MRMSSLRLDFQRPTQPFPLVGMVVLTLAIAITVLTGSYYYSLSVTSKDLEESLKRIEQKAGAQNRSPHPHPEIRGDIKLASEVLHQLTLPWDDLFQAVESSTIPQVTLLGMEPDLEKHVVNISCEAKDIASMLSFMKQ